MQALGDAPLLQPHGSDWHRICGAFLDRAAEDDSQDAPALEMFTGVYGSGRGVYASGT